MKKSILYIILSFALLGCGKNVNTIGEQAYLYGILTAENQYLTLEAQASPIKNRIVYISSSPSDSVNYIYRVSTDSVGQYHFKGLRNDKDYLIFFRDTIKGNFYSIYQTLKPSENPQMLKATIATKDATGAIFKVADSLGFPVNDAEIYLFRSKVLAEAKTSKGSVYQLKSDANGEALKTGMSLGEWFTYVTFKIDTSNHLQAIQNLVVNKGQPTNITVVLRK
ncbi:hypothetical protein A5893_01265 [Pedobacter psychrophilus]|uniref:Uncharacterized protein n=1 Tax=Pedobacter psychrophilus TaxID=1826909 RepID=A0A179DLL4_9SPHI|nr:hypothetical protein [Pedobacter psychrophilus]OAQ41774.1 hypothetical protein A5893_01265 [Pedobacter psychrophilus]